MLRGKGLFFLLLITSIAAVQVQTDTIIKNNIYKSYFCYALKEPLYVTYHLYKGGGDCDRNEQHFSFKRCDVQTA